MDKLVNFVSELLKCISKHWSFLIALGLWLFCGFVVLWGSSFIQPYVLTSVYDVLYTFSVICVWVGIAFFVLFLFGFLRGVVIMVYLKSDYRIKSVIDKMSDDELSVLYELYFNKHCEIPMCSACFERFALWGFICYPKYADIHGVDCYLQGYVYRYLQKHEFIFNGKD